MDLISPFCKYSSNFANTICWDHFTPMYGQGTSVKAQLTACTWINFRLCFADLCVSFDSSTMLFQLVLFCSILWRLLLWCLHLDCFFPLRIAWAILSLVIPYEFTYRFFRICKEDTIGNLIRIALSLCLAFDSADILLIFIF